MTEPSSCWKMSEQIRRGGKMSPISIRLWRSCPSLQTNFVSEYVWLLTNSWTKWLLCEGWNWCFFFNLEALSQELIVTFLSWADSNSQLVVHGRDVLVSYPARRSLLFKIEYLYVYFTIHAREKYSAAMYWKCICESEVPHIITPLAGVVFQ